MKALQIRGVRCPWGNKPLLLPVTLPETATVTEKLTPATPQSSVGDICCELEFPSGILRICGSLTPRLLRMLICEMKVSVQ